MLGMKTICEFLFFRNPNAVIEIASNRRALLVGFVLVLSAGFAREYDGEYLVAEPWHLVLPHLASMFSCFCMTTLLFVVQRSIRRRVVREQKKSPDDQWQEPSKVGFWNTYLSFLSLFWMTAPLAWIYAIPFERFLSPANATSANLMALGLVATWRVALMIYAAKHVYGTNYLSVFLPVMLFADVVALTVLIVAPSPVVMIMGGIRLTESEMIIVNVRSNICLFGFGTLLIWLSGTFTIACGKDRWGWRPSVLKNPSISKALKWGCAICLLIWIPILPFTQIEQRLRYRAEKFLNNGELESFASFVKNYKQNDFPPHWDPPPRVGYGHRNPPPLEVAQAVVMDCSEDSYWLVGAYIEKWKIRSEFRSYRYSDSLSSSEEKALNKIRDQVPKSKEQAEQFAATLNGFRQMGNRNDMPLDAEARQQ